MDPNALLALISDLYGQLSAAQARIAELEQQIGESTPDKVRAVPKADIG